MSIGENIKKIRIEKGLTQKQLGDLCGMADSAIRRYESDRGNPKIETIEKIASALNVRIVDIMEQFTIEQYKSTSEYQEIEKAVRAEEGIVAILTDIYGKVEDKSIEGRYGSGHYYLVGNGTKQFILYDGDIDALYESTKASIPALVERMKDSRSEKEAIQEYLKFLDSPTPPEYRIDIEESESQP